ncbi:protein Shroom2 isoform X2 [Solea solea]|uniref:protein Shroom2 isoform X2 n=1 Tax=Solea solea TaxID=90069 RepID=UPI00272D45CD|nr:protein Shroom2 isoform X2 [Solea solea]
MDSDGYRNDFHYTETGSVWQHVTLEPSHAVDQRSRDADGWKLVEVFLSGGAPWGFTLRGGLEHREPLLITKVEEGSKAAVVCLQVGDELVNINEIPLSGYRQEAICLVKGSHKTLSVVVKRNMKMVDIVAQKMPSENDVHVARSFLTKILRSSMRRNEPISRPHSWHSTKFNENQSEAAKTQSPSPPVWHNRYDASSSSADLSSGWEQTNLRRVSDQFSSLGSMDSLEHVPHPYTAGQLSPAKSNNSMEHLGGGKRDSAYSSFSTSSGTPDYTLSKSNAASTENVLYKVSQWDAGGKHGSRNSHGVAEGGRQDDKLMYFQMPGSEAPQTEDPAGSRQSSSSRSNFGPVWHVPEKKKSSASPPPPPPPARRDSFAATKVHERGLVITEEPESRGSSEANAENLRSHNLPLKNQGNHTQFGPNKQFSTSSSDVLQSQPHHPRHHSDKSTVYSPPRPTSKPQSASGYQCSTQEPPTNQRRSVSGTAAEQNSDSSAHSRYYCVTTCQPTQTHPQLMSGKPEERRSFSGVESGSERKSVSPQTAGKAKYPLPQQHGKDSNGYNRHHVPTVPETSDDRGRQRGHNSQNAEIQNSSFPPTRPSENRRSLPLQPRDVPQDVRKISAHATPMLHSLSLDASDPREKPKGSASDESPDNKQMKRNERFATTLRNEIQMRKAKLQKSKSAAALPCAEDETEEDQDVWKSTPMSPDSSFTNIYKDHLKEAQARVLKATSFRRKDLEPVLGENSAAESLPSYPSSALGRRDVPTLPTLSELASTKSGPAAAPVTRIGGRKRFPTEKKVRSFSEPDKIHQVGVSCDENTSSSLDQQMLLSQGDNPGLSKHLSSHSHEDHASVTATGDVVKGLGSDEDAQKHKQSVLDQQRLGTFAEYEARWNPQKNPAETRASGRYRSADDILETRPEDRKSTSCVHERSRSSPSAEIYGQKFPVSSRSSEGEPAELLSSPARFSDCTDREKQAEFKCLSAPPADGAAAAAAAAAAENHTPTSASHSLTQPPSTPRKKPPPPRCSHISEAFTHSSSSTEGSSAFNPTPPAKADCEQGKGLGAAPHYPASSSRRHSGPSSMEERRSPSPQFSPQRLSDRPPVSLQDQDANRMDHVIESPNSAVKKVPIRIVHSEGVPEKENSLFPHHGDVPAAADDAADEVEPPGGNRLNSLAAARHDSVFCAFSRQRASVDTVPAAPTDDTHVTNNSLPTPPLADEPATCSRRTEDQKREELLRDIMGKDKSLADVLDQSKMKTTMDLMEGIFPEGEQLLEEAQQRRKLPTKQSVSRPPEEREKEESVAAAVTMVTSSAYYSTSAPKAELLNKMKDMQETEDDSEEELDMDLSNKKELIDSLSRKLQVLREARQSLQEDVLDNNALGDEVEVRVQQVCKPNELDKFRMFVGDLDKVVSLLLSLSGRLARVENALNSLEEDATPGERRTLTEKRKLLIRQHDDAKELKENLDRRERVVYDILASHLDDECLADYEHFVKMKSALIIEQRKLEDRVKLGEEQLKCLLDSLSIEQRLVL